MLKANQLTKVYDQHKALDQLNLEVKAGEIFCLLGSNGAGKTTTINLFLGFIDPTEGEANIDGQPVKNNKHYARSVTAYIPENLMLYPNLTGIENLKFFSGLSGKDYETAALENFLTRAGLQSAAFHQYVGKYSKGMRQKVGIAIALAKKAKVLLLDEPTSGLDPKASNEFANLLQEMKSEGMAILMATHDLFRAKESGTHIGIMRDGQLRETLSSGEINHTDLEKLYLKHMN